MATGQQGQRGERDIELVDSSTGGCPFTVGPILAQPQMNPMLKVSAGLFLLVVSLTISFVLRIDWTTSRRHSFCAARERVLILVMLSVIDHCINTLEMVYSVRCQIRRFTTDQVRISHELERLKTATFVRGSKYTASRRAVCGRVVVRAGLRRDQSHSRRCPCPSVVAQRSLSKFVATQPPSSAVLKPDSFAWLKNVFAQGLRSIQDTLALITAMVTNDLGKDLNLATHYAKLTGTAISKVNHDMILYHAFKAEMIPAPRPSYRARQR